MKQFLNSILNKILDKHSKNNIQIKASASRQFPYEIQSIAENLYVPWAIAISDDVDLYVTERSGS